MTNTTLRMIVLSLATALPCAIAAQPVRPLPYTMDPRAPIAAKRLQHLTLFDSSYHRARDIWIYTPTAYDPRATAPYPLMVAFDGYVYQDTMPLPFILDTLAATHNAPAFVGVLIDDGGGPERIADLGNAARMSDFLGKQLVPYVRAHWHVTTDPHRVIVTGSSAGGLGSAFVAFKRPDLFSNVLSQSGAFWRGAEASNDAPYEWLTAQFAASPKKDIRFYMDVGELESRGALGGAAPSILNANRKLRDALKAKGYSVTYAEVPAGQHAPQYWMKALPTGIVALTQNWR